MKSHADRLAVRLSLILLLVLLRLMSTVEGFARPTHILRILKSERKMELLVDGRLARTFTVALGGAPTGDKIRQGDERTPEGAFYVAWKNARSRFHRFLGLSYPMTRHADRGFADGLIGRATRDQIRSAVERRAKPPQTTALGGWVGIHGGGASSDWTLGCIAVTDDEIEWLFSQIRVGDEVTILP